VHFEHGELSTTATGQLALLRFHFAPLFALLRASRDSSLREKTFFCP
jgi:hypothetical protein